MSASIANRGPVSDASLERVPGYDWVHLMRGRFRRFRFRRHAHAHLSLAVVVRGVMQVSRPAGSDHALPGDVVTVHADDVHWGGEARAGGWDICTLFVDEEALRTRIRRGYGFPQLVSRAPDVARTLVDLHASHAASGTRLERESRLHVALDAVLGRIADGRHRRVVPARAPDVVRRAREYLDAHYRDNPSLEELAAAAGMSPTRLCRTFAAHVGMPPHAYLLHRRVREAERLLARGTDVAAVALACGFADQSHLTRTFRQANGITPGRYRADLVAGRRPDARQGP